MYSFPKTRSSKRLLIQKYGHFTVYDIETEPFSEEFRNATGWQQRRKHAPNPRVMVVYSSKSDEYHTFWPEQMDSGVELLLSSDTIVSFNGQNFDESVLIKYGSMKKAFSGQGKRSFDLLNRLEKKHGFRAGLDGLAKLNLREGKHTSGREMDENDGEKLVEACRSDVRQTGALFEIWAHNPSNIRYPYRRQRKYLIPNWIDEMDTVGQNIVTGCFECGSDYGEVLEEEMDSMSDGSYADFMAGNWGFWRCWDCGEVSYRDA
jgi:hypothetical protein